MKRVRRILSRYRRSRASDALFCVVLILLLVSGDLLDNETSNPLAYVWVFDVLVPVALYWRRRQPFWVFVSIAATSFGQWLAHVSSGSGACLLLALYAVGRYDRNRQRLAVAAGLTYLLMGLVALRSAPEDSALAALVLLVGTATAAWVLGVYRRTKSDYLDSVVERAATAERERDQRAQLAVAGERARISREMHDIVAHSLSVMIALGDGASASVERAPVEAREAMEQLSALGRQALAEMRRLLSVLRDPADEDLAPQPGVAEIDELVAQVRIAGLSVELMVVGEPAVLSATAQLTVYRLVQEGLTNVLKHAPAATKAVVTLRYESGGMQVAVENDDAAPLEPPSAFVVGHGVAGMRERAAVFGGTVEAGRRAGGGWRVASDLLFESQAGS